MKFDKSLLQRATDKYVVDAREVSSRGTSFLIVILGVILQASHTTLLMYNVSAFESTILKGVVSAGIGIFISMALAIFTLKHDGKNKDIESLINVFFYFEVFTNLFYYFDSILLAKGFEVATINSYIYFAASLPFAYIMPYTIKKFAGVIAADKSVDFGSVDIVPKEPEAPIEYNVDEIQEMINSKVAEAIDIALAESEETKQSIDETIKNTVGKILDAMPMPQQNEVDVEAIINAATDAATKAVSGSTETILKKAVTVLQEHFDEKYIKKGGQVVLRTGAGQETTVDVV